MLYSLPIDGNSYLQNTSPLVITTCSTFCLRDDNNEFVFVVGQSEIGWSDLDVVVQRAGLLIIYCELMVYFVLWLCD
ncbi:hypothetical protein EUGRSUZ_H01729 [Eucalyptus grandis]|uniref:Uncharacterized protein n=2 Tax=Eucalyptus grandis TaxID=71139 RepID=A0ACC3JRM7_EUCGR|nr:hypothetical protein EUGRSUZ_H01729 [Eucalyptus grandis]